jgi:hypothetical protein
MQGSLEVRIMKGHLGKKYLGLLLVTKASMIKNTMKLVLVLSRQNKLKKLCLKMERTGEGIVRNIQSMGSHFLLPKLMEDCDKLFLN